MTRAVVHIGLPGCGAERLQQVLDRKRDALAKIGVLVPRASGRKNDTRLFMAVTDPDRIDPMRWHRGHAAPEAQAKLRDELRSGLTDELGAAGAETLILTAHQLATLASRSELERLRDLVAAVADRTQIVIHVDEQARVLTRYYGEQVLDGRTAGLDAELALAASGSWREAAIGAPADPLTNMFPDIQSPPFWLDYAALSAEWSAVFGGENVVLRRYDRGLFFSAGISAEICAAFDLADLPGKVDAAAAPDLPSAAWLARSRQVNAQLVAALAAGRLIPRQLWRQMLGEIEVPGPPIAPGSLSALSDSFAAANAGLVAANPDLEPALRPDPPLQPYAEADPGMGFRASQYFAAFLPRIDAATKDERKAKAGSMAALAPAAAPGGRKPARSAETPQAPLPPAARDQYDELVGGRFAPHNALGDVDEEADAPPYDPAPARELARGSTGNVIVACMKNEGPYIVEWVAYHRAIGFDGLLVYTNDCDDGTDAILDRLQALGVVEHRDNSVWKGNSPQQHALNMSLKEKLVRNADWIAHIDVDEFINIRCGNGTVADLLARIPEATNIALTWRLFGNDGVIGFDDRPVIGQFTTCAPKYCPKPHTVWGFKSFFRNIGAYEKISCHRPNKLRPGKADKVHWFNGSGQPMRDGYKEKGWRSDTRSVGYDLVQLNHYALRSADSFLIKRQRGRALHVDRTIGLNYWIRMDWSDHRDVTIQRNLPRLKAEMARLMHDSQLRALHERAVVWHRDKALSLRANPEFSDLFDQAMNTRLAPLERVAYALALDVES